jgi:arylsulfatase A-like enzyme
MRIAMDQDIVLLTVDSWRYDTTNIVPNMSRRLSGPSNLICAGAATNWAFPAILSGMYYPSAYDGSGNLRSDICTLPDRLSGAGYTAGGFVACNPYVSKWSDRFDTFWNAGVSSDLNKWYSNTIQKWASRAYRTVLFRKRAPANTVASQAAEWYDAQESPRFLWMHIMEPHFPYYPGLKRAREVGLIDAYRSVLSYQRNGDKTPAEQMAVQRSLYNKCVELFDDRVSDLLEFVDDDAMILAFGDHGEEFDHGHYDHERLYDECVRVPLYYQNVPESFEGTVRQIDLAPTLLNILNVDVPDEWEGSKAASLSERPAFMITPEPGTNLLHSAIRTDEKKLIKSYDQETGEVQKSEYYDLQEDPQERQDKSGSVTSEELEEELDAFVSEHESALNVGISTGMDSAVVESRLENLGYK